jgi:hypothetical protein
MNVSDTLIAAFLSVVAIVILAPLANHFVTKYRERRSLRATLWVHEAPLPLVLQKYFQDLRYPSLAQTSFSSPFNNTQLDAFHFLKGYMKLTLYNPSKKKLNAITVTLAQVLADPLYQIDDQTELHGPVERKILIGDLQPHRSCTIHIWTSFAYVDWHYTRLPILFEITADEFDKRTLKFPLLGYLKSQRQGRASRYFMWASLGFSAAIWLYLLLEWYRRL